LQVAEGLHAAFLNPDIPAAPHCAQQAGGKSLQLCSRSFRRMVLSLVFNILHSGSTTMEDDVNGLKIPERT